MLRERLGPVDELLHARTLGNEQRLVKVDKSKVGVVRLGGEHGVDKGVEDTLVIVAVDATAIDSLLDDGAQSDPWNGSGVDICLALCKGRDPRIDRFVSGDKV